MTTPFAFVPRAVSKHTKEWQGISRPPPSPSPPPDPTTDSELEDDEDDCSDLALAKAKSKGNAIRPTHSKESIVAQDIAALISLALSDYNIWLDPDLRWKLDACLGDDASSDEAGFVPINYLLRRAPFRGSLQLANGQPDPSETEVVKALRTHASHVLEVRMRVHSSVAAASSGPSSSVWYGAGKTSRKKDVGGYDVRRRDWLALRNRPSRGWTRARWNEVTAYVECIPPQYRTIGGIARFVESLLASTSELGTDAGLEPCVRVQNVSLPPHYLDKPGDAPKCKGYALITFLTTAHLHAVLRAWPWDRCRGPVPTKESRNEGEGEGRSASSIVMEAHKYGLRTISKARWDAFNEEYLLHKQYLVDEIARSQPETEHPDEEANERDLTTPPDPCLQKQTQTTPSSPYPFDCLVFVRNLHPETNKTTLKFLFAQAFQDGCGIDYVDFNKGMDTCHLRLASPYHTTRLEEYFDGSTRRKVQAHGLDVTGQTPVQDDKSIVVERIQGKKEELYWGKVPEKVRRQAVDKVIKAQLGAGSQLSESTTSSGQKKTSARILKA